MKVTLDQREGAHAGRTESDDVFQSMSAFLGGAFVNDFNRFGRLYRVYVQADAGSSAEAGRHRQDLRAVENYRAK